MKKNNDNFINFLALKEKVKKQEEQISVLTEQVKKQEELLVNIALSVALLIQNLKERGNI